MMQAKTRFGGTDASIFLLALIVLLLAGSIIFAVYTLRSDPVEEMLSSDRVIIVLYVIEKDQKPLSTFVLMCYPQTRRAAVFDIPGEIGMLLRRINRVDRIDAAYTPGKISAFESEIESLLGIDIAFSVVFDAENLGRTVDLIQGVELFIPSRVNIRDGDNLVLFSSGISRLDGDKAVSYISYEAPDEDSEMAVFRRQRFFMGFLKRQAEMNIALKNPAVFQLYQSFMQSNLNQRAKLRLLDEIANIDLDRINIHTVGGTPREVSGKMLLIPYYEGNLVKEIVRQTLSTLTSPTDSSLTDRVFTVEVLNGTTVTGLAGRTAEVVRGFGYDVISIGNADHTGYEKSVVIDRSGYEERARGFAGILRCKNINFEATQHENSEMEFAMHSIEYRSDFTFIIGRDFDGRYVIEK
ncbi:MAG: LCP family protein [Treponema sp.]|jgi:anionic cell wall polymer biosynthesis LytR-Cps2A-Psr (LCP) family protein|nr:LCP family protein [Treponema sp.]